MTPDSVAKIVERRGTPAFLDQLRAADAAFSDRAFEPKVAEVLRAEPRLTELWGMWSQDQRWTPSAYVRAHETGWYDSGYENVRLHGDEAAAVADFIHRMAAHLAADQLRDRRPNRPST